MIWQLRRLSVLSSLLYGIPRVFHIDLLLAEKNGLFLIMHSTAPTPRMMVHVAIRRALMRGNLIGFQRRGTSLGPTFTAAYRAHQVLTGIGTDDAFWGMVSNARSRHSMIAMKLRSRVGLHDLRHSRSNLNRACTRFLHLLGCTGHVSRLHAFKSL